MYKSERSGELVEIPMTADGYTIPYLPNVSDLNRSIAYVIPLQQQLQVESQAPLVDAELVNMFRL